MRCPACGHHNSDLATRCSACGSELVEDAGTSFAPNGSVGDGLDARSFGGHRPVEPCGAESRAYESRTWGDVDDVDRPYSGSNEAADANETDDSVACGEQTDALPLPFASQLESSDSLWDNGQVRVAAGPVDGAPMPTSEGDTLERPQIAQEMPEAPDGQEPELHEVAGAAGKLVHAKGRRLVGFFSSHQRGLGIGLALFVLVVLGAVWCVFNLVNGPSYDQIAQDVAACAPTYPYIGGTYGSDLDIPLSNVSVTKREATKTPEGMEVAEDVGPAAFVADAEITYDDGRMRAVRNVSATYVRSDDGWEIYGELTDHGASLSAHAGVDEEKVLANMGMILSTAGSGDVSLSDIYAGGSFSIVGNTFEEAPDKDTATNVIVIACHKDDDFYAYDGNVTATFAFESGEWRLRQSEPDDRATTRTYANLEGAWTGPVIDYATSGGTCYGAQGYPLTINITYLDDSSSSPTSVQGTLTGLAHYHKRVVRDEMEDEGDVLLEGVPFTGTLSTTYDAESGSSLTLEATVSADVDHELDFVVSFGTADDPSVVLCTLTSTYTYEELMLLLIPHNTTARFVDTYRLYRAE